MIIADLVDEEDGERMGRVYLATAPLNGDTIHTQGVDVLVLRRVILDLGPEGGDDRLSMTLEVRIL